MASTLGERFYGSAARPLYAFVANLERHDLRSAIGAVSGGALTAAFRAAVMELAQQAGLAYNDVLRFLPTFELDAAVSATLAPYAAVAHDLSDESAWLRTFASECLGRVVEQQLGLDGLGIGTALDRLGQMILVNEPSAAALHELQTTLTVYDRVLLGCIERLDACPELASAFAREQGRRRAKRIVTGCAGAAAAIIVGAWAFGFADRSALAAAPAPPMAAAPHIAPLTDLSGRWIDATGAAFNATVSGDQVLFHAADPSTFPREGREPGALRFALRRSGTDEALYAVEDRVHPVPPKGTEYDLKRGFPASCREVWRDVGGMPLRARRSDDRLLVELVKLDSAPAQLQSSKGRVVSCGNSATGRAVRVELVLTR